MSGYEVPELGRIEDAIDALNSPTSTDVFQATRPYDERAIASVAAQRATSGGGGVILSASLTLDDAGIRAMASTPAVLVPATTVINYDSSIVPDVVFVPIAATVITSIVTGYALAGETPTMLLAYSSDWANNASDKCGVSTSLGSSGTWQTDLPCPPTRSPGVEGAVIGLPGQPINGDWLDNALVLTLSDATPTGGDAANTLTATVLYHVVSTT